MKAGQMLMLRLAENQIELKPSLTRLADVAESSLGQDDVLRSHLRNIEAYIARLTEDSAAGPGAERAGIARRNPPARPHHRRRWPKRAGAEPRTADQRMRDRPPTPRRSSIDIWPGFVDALSQLLMVIIFMLLVFTAGQFYLSDALVRARPGAARIAAAGRSAGRPAVAGDERANEQSAAAARRLLTAQLKSAKAERDPLTAPGRRADR